MADLAHELTHFNDEGRAHMVDVTDKDKTYRTATARGAVSVNEHTFQLIEAGGIKKGDVLAVAQVAGIMAAKRCSDLIPMCHPIALTGVDISFELDSTHHTIEIQATAKCTGETGVEMEALTAVSVAALTIYDMCKAVQRDIRIGEIHLQTKTGGKSGDYRNESE
ncbi:MAG: cyclic pyranopterin monophosphate synthase MoaC [Clostridiales Family XIII bacterium]|jgi:cyclic pyranopterin phosphate synthase|nr:cyclic pyranopterin monophosphate synthase MoaC [Clostridiales Family XIII bacterium]